VQVLCSLHYSLANKAEDAKSYLLHADLLDWDESRELPAVQGHNNKVCGCVCVWLCVWLCGCVRLAKEFVAVPLLIVSCSLTPLVVPTVAVRSRNTCQAAGARAEGRSGRTCIPVPPFPATPPLF